jgi:purine nucleoside phosphorylase
MSDKSGIKQAPWPRAEWGFVLGSGLGNCCKDWELLCSLSFQEAGLQEPSVSGHQGLLEWRRGPGNTVVVFARGRLHSYEGHGVIAVCQLVDFFADNHVPRCLITCAAGGVAPTLNAGDLVLVNRILFLNRPECWREIANLLERPEWQSTLTGSHPGFHHLVEKNWVEKDHGRVVSGLHAQMTGPNYETRAEIRMLSRLGVSTVGMSTGVELRRAQYRGLISGALAVVANPATGLCDGPITHGEVLMTMEKAAQNLERLIFHLVLETNSFHVDQ